MKPTKGNYLFAAVTLFAAGALGGIIDVLGAGSLLGTTAQVIGYCGAGYYFARWRAS